MVTKMPQTELSTNPAAFGAVVNLVGIPFALIPVLTVVMGDRSKPILARINGLMEKASDVIMPLLLLAIGLALLLDSVWYFVRGESFF